MTIFYANFMTVLITIVMIIVMLTKVGFDLIKVTLLTMTSKKMLMFEGSRVMIMTNKVT